MTDYFTYCDSKKGTKQFSVQISDEAITLVGDSGDIQETLSVNDIVGCLLVDKSVQQMHLQIFLYPLSSSKNKRVCRVISLQPVSTGKDRHRQCLKVKLAVLCATRGILKPDSDEQALNKSVNSLKKLLILINPKSGKGHAKKTFFNKIAVMLDQADVYYDAEFTTGPDHARRFVRTADLSQHRGIVVISGDGLLFEVINGLLERPDWESAIRTPIGLIPQGSGNGIARTLADSQNEPYLFDPVLSCTLNVIRARETPVDLMRVLHKSSESTFKTYYASLSVGFGFLADVDIESERLRGLGEVRFTVWAVHRLLNLRTYKAKICYLPAVDKDDTPTLPNPRPRLLHSTTVVDDTLDRKPLKRTSSTYESYDSDACSLAESVTEDSFMFAGSSGGAPNDIFGPPSRFPPLTDPVPTDWTSIEGEFIMIYAVSQKYIGTEVLLAPKSTLSDGLIYLLIIKAGTSKGQLLQVLLGLENGTHVNLPCCEMIPVTAFRLEPQNSSSCLTIDGEQVPTAPIQVEILPSLLNFLLR